jgi:Kef-type K+ transport system membrane component KefB
MHVDFVVLKGVGLEQPRYAAPPAGMCSSVPLGALGGGSLELRADSALRDWRMLKNHPAKAIAVAVVGTVLPLVSSMLLVMALDSSYKLWPVGLACGVALAPTSVGMALEMLGGAKQLSDEECGQLITAADFIDDTLSLMALTMHVQIGIDGSGSTASLWGLQPLVWSVLLCVGGAMLSHQVDRTPADGFEFFLAVFSFRSLCRRCS